MATLAPRGNEEGFGLVEAVIALAIVAAMLGITFQTIAHAERSAADVQARRLAMLEARSVLAQVGVTIPVAPGSAQGVADGWAWHVDISSEAGDAPHQDVPISRVAVTVQDGGSRTLAHLETLRLAQ